MYHSFESDLFKEPVIQVTKINQTYLVINFNSIIRSQPKFQPVHGAKLSNDFRRPIYLHFYLSIFVLLPSKNIYVLFNQENYPRYEVLFSEKCNQNEVSFCLKQKKKLRQITLFSLWIHFIFLIPRADVCLVLSTNPPFHAFFRKLVLIS